MDQYPVRPEGVVPDVGGLCFCSRLDPTGRLCLTGNRDGFVRLYRRVGIEDSEFRLIAKVILFDCNDDSEPEPGAEVVRVCFLTGDPLRIAAVNTEGLLTVYYLQTRDGSHTFEALSTVHLEDQCYVLRTLMYRSSSGEERPGLLVADACDMHVLDQEELLSGKTSLSRNRVPWGGERMGLLVVAGCDRVLPGRLDGAWPGGAEAGPMGSGEQPSGQSALAEDASVPMQGEGDEMGSERGGDSEGLGGSSRPAGQAGMEHDGDDDDDGEEEDYEEDYDRGYLAGEEEGDDENSEEIIEVDDDEDEDEDENEDGKGEGKGARYRAPGHPGRGGASGMLEEGEIPRSDDEEEEGEEEEEDDESSAMNDPPSVFCADVHPTDSSLVLAGYEKGYLALMRVLPAGGPEGGDTGAAGGSGSGAHPAHAALIDEPAKLGDTGGKMAGEEDKDKGEDGDGHVETQPQAAAGAAAGEESGDAPALPTSSTRVLQCTARCNGFRADCPDAGKLAWRHGGRAALLPCSRGQGVAWQAHERAVTAVTFLPPTGGSGVNPQGLLAVSADLFGMIKLWDVSRPTVPLFRLQLFSGIIDSLFCLDCSPGVLWAQSRRGEIAGIDLYRAREGAIDLGVPRFTGQQALDQAKHRNRLEVPAPAQPQALPHARYVVPLMEGGVLVQAWELSGGMITDISVQRVGNDVSSSSSSSSSSQASRYVLVLSCAPAPSPAFSAPGAPQFLDEEGYYLGKAPLVSRPGRGRNMVASSVLLRAEQLLESAGRKSIGHDGRALLPCLVQGTAVSLTAREGQPGKMRRASDVGARASLLVASVFGADGPGMPGLRAACAAWLAGHRDRYSGDETGGTSGGDVAAVGTESEPGAGLGVTSLDHGAGSSGPWREWLLRNKVAAWLRAMGVTSAVNQGLSWHVVNHVGQGGSLPGLPVEWEALWDGGAGSGAVAPSSDAAGDDGSRGEGEELEGAGASKRRRVSP